MYKLKNSGMCGNYYGLLHSFLSDRYQRVDRNGQSSNWSHIKAGVPQGLFSVTKQTQVSTELFILAMYK